MWYLLFVTFQAGWMTIACSAQIYPTSTISQSEQVASYRARCDSLIDYYASRNAASYIDVAAKLYRQRNIKWALSTLDSLMQTPQGDMFWMYQFILVTFIGGDAIPLEMQARMRAIWRTYTPYRGDTENHWAMYYAGLYLIAQHYPNEPGDAWFNGRSSQENFEEARDYLLSWVDLTTSKGQGEFDSPDYMGYFIIPVSQLYAFASDPAMRQRAGMMLDYLIADFAVENLGGLYVGGHSRTYPVPVLEQWRVGSTGISWLLFGNTPYLPRGEAAILAMSGYQPPLILHYIATERYESYVHKELKRTRHRIRYSEERNLPVYKYTYMHNDFALGSLQGGLLQPIQQHTWDLTWRVDDPRSQYNTLFTLHPYSSAYELAMYFPEEPKLITDAVVKSKGTYDSPDKWTSASPYEQVFQHEETLIVLYDIPPGTRFPHISGFFPKLLSGITFDDTGWIFARGGNAMIAYYPLAPYEWIEEDRNWRLFSPSLRNGAIVHIASRGDYSSFDDFISTVSRSRFQTSTDPRPSVRFTIPGGVTLTFSYDEVPEVDGVPVDYVNWKLYEGPFLSAERERRQLEIRFGTMHRLLDFNTLTVKEWVSE